MIERRGGLLFPWGLAVFLLLVCTAAAQAVDEGAVSGKVLVVDLESAVSSGSAMFLENVLEEAWESRAALVVVRLDTPGGLATSMRQMVKAVLNSPVPVVVYVAPSGAGAASAGVLITIAGHVAAMAPGTNIGAAHPVSIGGKDIGQEEMSRKIVNDMASYGRAIANEKGRNGEWVEKAIRESVSITAQEALEQNVIDLVARDVGDLLEKIDGREVEVRGRKVVLETRGLEIVTYKSGFRDRLLRAISDPNISMLLLLLGAAGLYFEFTNPGAIFPGVIGAVALLLAIFSFQALPVNFVGLMLIGLAFVLFILEVTIASYGLLSIGGLVCLALGAVMLFEENPVSLSFLIPVLVFVGGFFVIVAGLAFRAHHRRPSGGSEGIVGEVGTVIEKIDREGLVFVHGEYWRARSEEIIEPGEEVEVVGIQRLVLTVGKRHNP